MREKRGELLNQVVIHLILIGIIFALFIMAVAGNVNARGIRQQIAEKQVALLIDSAVPGMSFEIREKSFGGFVHNVELRKGRLFISVDGYNSVGGYPYYSKYAVTVSRTDGKFVVSVK